MQYRKDTEYKNNLQRSKSKWPKEYDMMKFTIRESQIKSMKYLTYKTGNN